MRQNHLDRLKKLVEQGKVLQPTYGPVDSFLALSEEVGEVSTALNVERGHKGREIKESSAQELIDVIFAAYECLYLQDKDDQWIEDYAEKKLQKWEKRIASKLASGV